MTINETINGIEVYADISIDPEVDICVFALELDGIEFTLEQLDYLQHPILPELKRIIGIDKVVRITGKTDRYKL
jgi:hypothetical protein